jgi:hypothetical protein
LIELPGHHAHGRGIFFQMKFEIKTDILCATIVTVAAFFTIAMIQIYNTTIAIIEIYGSRVNFSSQYHGWFPIIVTIVILIISLNHIVGK